MRLLAALALALAVPTAAAPSLTGVNLAGGEFGGLKSKYGYGYIYPNYSEMKAFRDMGVTVFRVPVRWERLQPVLGGPLDRDEMERLDRVIGTASGFGIATIIDVHNYAKYRREKVGGPTVPLSAVADLWRPIASRYKSNARVIFGLMNEPVGIGANAWADVAGRAVTAIRATGAKNLILVPGVIWSGAHSWRKKVGVESNAEAMTGFVDPANNFAFDFHQYFDANSSGMGAICVSPAEAARRLAVASDWLSETGNRGFLSEFGVHPGAECQATLRAALTHLRQRPEWLGWTLWASAQWFGTYPMNIYPLMDPPSPTLATMKTFLAPRPND